jgi:hypothetical protein
LLPQAHEELVVTAVGVLELEEPDELLEVEELDAKALDGELEPDDFVVVVAAAVFAAAALASAGSWPVTSCAPIPPLLARKMAVAVATTRVRITLIRRLRARSRSATLNCCMWD